MCSISLRSTPNSPFSILTIPPSSSLPYFHIVVVRPAFVYMGLRASSNKQINVPMDLQSSSVRWMFCVCVCWKPPLSIHLISPNDFCFLTADWYDTSYNNYIHIYIYINISSTNRFDLYPFLSDSLSFLSILLVRTRHSNDVIPGTWYVKKGEKYRWGLAPPNKRPKQYKSRHTPNKSSYMAGTLSTRPKEAISITWQTAGTPFWYGVLPFRHDEPDVHHRSELHWTDLFSLIDWRAFVRRFSVANSIDINPPPPPPSPVIDNEIWRLFSFRLSYNVAFGVIRRDVGNNWNKIYELNERINISFVKPLV